MKRLCLVLFSVFMLSVLAVAKDIRNHPLVNSTSDKKYSLLPNEAILGPTDEQIRQMWESVQRKRSDAKNQPFQENHYRISIDPELFPLKNISSIGSRQESTVDFNDFYLYYVRDITGCFIAEEYDSLGVWFRPKHPCRIKEVQILLCEESDLLNKELEICIYDVPDTLYPTDEYQSLFPGNGIYDFLTNKVVFPSPQGKLYGKYPMPVTSYGYSDTDWNILNLSDFDGALNVGMRDFFVAFQLPPGNDNGADIYYMEDNFGYGPYHGFKWYVDGGTYSPGTPNWVSRLNFSLRVKIEHDVPWPQILSHSILNSVYYSCNPGPYPVSVNIINVGDTLQQYIPMVKLIYFTGDISDTDTLDISTNRQAGLSHDTYVGEIPSFSIGTVISYYFTVEFLTINDQGEEYISSDKSSINSFQIMEASVGTNILIVEDGYYMIPERYTDVLDANGWKYDIWNTNEYGPPALCELQYYSTLFWLQGQGTGGNLAQGLDTSIVAQYLDDGGNLFLVSADYIGTVQPGSFGGLWGNASYPFLTDYLKIFSFRCDANLFDTRNSSDSLYVGIDGNPVSGFLVADTLCLNPISVCGYNWADEVSPADDAMASFLVYSESDDDWVTASTMYDGSFKMVFLPWFLESAADQSQFEQIIKNVLLFFNEKTAPLVTIESGPRYVVTEDSGPYEVIVSASDGDGTVTAVELGISTDGETFTYSDMAIEGDCYTAEIPDIEIGDTLYYHIRVEDNEGLYGFSETYMINKIDFTPSNQLLYCGDDPYDWYYGSSVDSIVVSSLNRVGVCYDYYDVDQYGPPSYQGFLDRYPAVIWHGYADWYETFPYYTEDNPFAPFINNGGDLLFSSEEMLGTLLGWDGYVTTQPGQSVYDVLGISWYAPDMAYDTLRIFPGSEQDGLVCGMDTKLILNELPFGFQADIVDPVNWGSATPILDAWVPGWGLWYSSYACYTAWHEDSTYRRIVLPFSLASLDDKNRDAFLANVIDYFGIVDAVDDVVEALPTKFALKQNFPNPFNPVTSIAFDLPAEHDVYLTVYNMLGQKIRTLVNDHRAAGRYAIQWDGKDDSGHMLGSGVYFYNIQAGNFNKTAKMVLLK